jgi:C4-type Zn-finger protein
VNIDTYTFHGGSCINSKRVYSNAVFSWDCPKCKVSHDTEYNQSPLIYAGHCHKFYCDECEYESDEFMYTIESTSDDNVDIKPSSINNLKVFKKSIILTQL